MTEDITTEPAIEAFEVPQAFKGKELAPLYASLIKAQLEVQPAEHDSHNKQQNYHYTSAESVLDAGRLCLARNGLCAFELEVDPRETGSQEQTTNAGRGYTMECGDLRIVYRLAHESGIHLDFGRKVPWMTGLGRPREKAQAGAMTYSLGYFLRGLLLIPRPDTAEVAVDHRDDSEYIPGPRSSKGQGSRPQQSQAAPPPAKPERTLTADEQREQLRDRLQKVESLELHDHERDALAEIQALIEQGEFGDADVKLTHIKESAGVRAGLARLAHLELNVAEVAQVEQAKRLRDDGKTVDAYTLLGKVYLAYEARTKKNGKPSVTTDTNGGKQYALKDGNGQGNGTDLRLLRRQVSEAYIAALKPHPDQANAALKRIGKIADVAKCDNTQLLTDVRDELGQLAC